MSGLKSTEAHGEAKPVPGGRMPDATKRRQTALPVWWIASLIFHALVLGWLFFLSPVRVIDRAASKTANPTPNVNPARAAKVMEQVRELQAANLAGEVRALEEARRELTLLEAQRRDALRLAVSNAPVPLAKIAAAQDNAVKAQAAAEAALKRANDQVPPDASDSSALTNVTAAVREAQTGAGQFQAEALEALALADPKFEPAYQAQSEANAAQSRAAQAQAAAEGQFSGAAALAAKTAPIVEDIGEARQRLRTLEAELAGALNTSVMLSNSLPQLQAQAGTAQAAYAAAQSGGDSKVFSDTKRRASDMQKAADRAQKDLTRALSNIFKSQERVAKETGRIEELSRKTGPPGVNPETMQRSAAEELREAQRLQAEALAAQSRAARAFSDARSGVISPAATTAAQTPEDLAGVYQAAVQTEAELAEAYRRLRATDLALQRQIPLGRAMELTDAARPARPDLAASLSGSQGGADAAAQRQAVLEARAQIAAMRSLADSMVAQARGLGAGNGRHQMLEQLAAEDDNQRAKDLTGAMRGGAGSGSGNSGAGRGSTGSSPGSGGAGAGGGGPGGGTGAGPGSGTAGGGAGASGPGLGGSGDSASSGPPPVSGELAAVPGRVIGAGAMPGRWMFVDSWYLLGPFDNAGRANLEKQFPPETVVDLNATYVGKRGRPVRWEFFQSPQPRVVPPFDGFNPLPSGATDGGGAFKSRDLEYIIYYGCTELRAEVECDVWLAVGSDDFSKLWIEDQLVWASGKKHKSWRVDEGFRKVRLKQGVNRVLIRVENGHAQSEFSLAVCAQ
jgi:hypothetical protein